MAQQPMPPPDQEQPGAGGPPQQGGDQQGGAVSTMLQNVDKAIDMLSNVITQSKATNPAEKQLIGQIDQLFGKLMTSLGQTDAEGDNQTQGQQQSQPVPNEAGGNKGAIPVM